MESSDLPDAVIPHVDHGYSSMSTELYAAAVQ